jgi:hypothetical protein
VGRIEGIGLVFQWPLTRSALEFLERDENSGASDPLKKETGSW